ncbi:MAG: hypothetical protein JWR75_1152 [Devosia sp.]|nr:hypothetical protein [Devosia sp.]
MNRPALVTRFHLLLLLAIAGVTITGFLRIPATELLPVHLGLDGSADWLWPREPALLVMPILALVLAGSFFALSRLASIKRLLRSQPVLEITLTGLLLLLGAFQTGILLIGVGSDIDLIRFVTGGVALLLLIIGLELPRADPSAYAGIRLPWILAEPAAYRATHRLTGTLFVIGGIGLAFATWFWPDPATLFIALMTAIAVPLIVGGIASVLLVLRRQA